MTHSSLGARLRLLRARQGLTLVEAAQKVNVGRDTLSAIERGYQRPTFPTLKKLAEGYGVDVEELLEMEEPPASKEDPSEGAPQIPAEVFVEHGIELTDAEAETVNNMLQGYTAAARLGESVEIYYDADVDMTRVHMLIDYAVTSGILTPEEVVVISEGVRAKLVAGDA